MPKWGTFKFSTTRPPGKKFGHSDVDPPVGSGPTPWLGTIAPTVEERETIFELSIGGCIVGGSVTHTFSELWIEQATLNAEIDDPSGSLQSLAAGSLVTVTARTKVNGVLGSVRTIGTYRLTAGPSANITAEGNRTLIQGEDAQRSMLASRVLLGNTPIRFLTDIGGSGSPLSTGVIAYLGLAGLSASTRSSWGPGLPSQAIDENWTDEETHLSYTSSPYKRLDDPPVDMFSSPPTCVEFMQMLRKRYGQIFYLRLEPDGIGVTLGAWGDWEPASVGIAADVTSSYSVSNTAIGVPLLGIDRQVSPAGVTSRSDVGIVVIPSDPATKQPPVYLVRPLAEYRSGSTRNPPDGNHGVLCYWIQDQNGLHAPSNADVNPYINAVNADRVSASIDSSFLYGQVATSVGIDVAPFATGTWLLTTVTRTFDMSPMSYGLNWLRD